MRYKILLTVLLITGLFVRCAWFGGGYKFQVEQSKPKLKQSAPLIYPAEAKANQQEGTAILELRITEEGIVEDVVLKKSSGHALLDSTALDYGRKLVFTPATWNHNPVAVWYSWRTEFKLFPVYLMQQFSVETYVNEVLDLMRASQIPNAQQSRSFIKDIFQHHEAYVEYLNQHPDENHNPAIRPFISNPVYNTWAAIWNKWPLRFVVYHDFIIQFPNSSETDYAKARMIYLLKQDIQHLKENPELDPQKEIIKKLVAFHDNVTKQKHF